MSVRTWTEASCDQCGKNVRKQGADRGWGYTGWTPRGWLNVFGKLLCGWKCVAAYANEQASKPKPVKKKTAAKKKPMLRPRPQKRRR